jgi:cytochrome P450
VHQQSLNRSPKDFCEPNAFCPERWLASAKADAHSPYHNDNLEAAQSFSIGSWACIGKALGLAELRTVIANLVWHFDLQTAPGGRDVQWLTQKSYAMMEKQPLDVQLVYVGSD